MNDYLKQYDVVIRTIGPVYIGSGKEISKKEYILDKNSIYVVDQFKLYNYIKKKGIQKRFDEFLMNNNNSLEQWLQKNDISKSDIKNCYRYVIEHTDTALSRGTRVSVNEFMRDPYGMPYVPGSSIKGMLRSIIISYELLKEPDNFEDNKTDYRMGLQGRNRRNTLLRNEQRNLEAKILYSLNRNERKYNDAVNDCFAGIRVSDSVPLSNDDMILCQRCERHVDGTIKSLNVLRECIKPNVDIHFTITIDESMFNYSLEDINKAVSCFSEMYDNVFKSKFVDVNGKHVDTVYLGGGVGFVSKTDIYPLFGKNAVDKVVDIFDATNVPKQHKHYKDKGYGVSPHILKVTKYKGKEYNMGECCIKLC